MRNCPFAILVTIIITQNFHVFSYFTDDLLKTIYVKYNHINLNSISERPCNVLYQSEQKD